MYAPILQLLPLLFFGVCLVAEAPQSSLQQGLGSLAFLGDLMTQ